MNKLQNKRTRLWLFLSLSPPPSLAGHDAVLLGRERGRVQLAPRPGRHLLGGRPGPPAEHLRLLRARPHLRLQLRLRRGRLLHPG